jgi:DNA-binding protein YbaB
MEYQCKEAQKLADMYREQVIQLEDQLSKNREEGNVGKELFKVVVQCILHLSWTDLHFQMS